MEAQLSTKSIKHYALTTTSTTLLYDIPLLTQSIQPHANYQVIPSIPIQTHINIEAALIALLPLTK